jgi:hypothetical protein
LPEGQLSSFVCTKDFAGGTVLAKAERRSDPEVSKRVEAKSGGSWYKARVIDAKSQQYRVHYYGYEDSDDEWVKVEQLRDWKMVQYVAGSSVEVEWKGKWYPATVLKAERGVHLIHYTGYDDSWDEWVSPDRIRLLKAV